MKRELVCAVRCMLSCILLLALSAAAPALAQFERVGVIHPSLPEIVIRIEDAGETDDSLDRPNLLRVHVSAQDGSFSQELVYRSLERADADGAAALVTLRDVNFDGYQDLLLLAAQGGEKRVSCGIAVGCGGGRVSSRHAGIIMEHSRQGVFLGEQTAGAVQFRAR